MRRLVGADFFAPCPLAKLTAKKQLTLPESITSAVGRAEYFDVETSNDRILPTPVRIQHGDAVAWTRQAPAARTTRMK